MDRQPTEQTTEATPEAGPIPVPKHVREQLDANTKEQEQRPEYDRQLESQKRKVPRVYAISTENLEQEFLNQLEGTANKIIEDEWFEIYDIQKKAATNDAVIGTSIFVMIKPGGRIKPLRAAGAIEGVICEKCGSTGRGLNYSILEGVGTLVIDDYPQIIWQGTEFTVEPGVKHNIVNSSIKKPLKYKIDYSGYLDLRELYYPMREQTKKAKESMDQAFKEAGKTVENTPAKEPKKEMQAPPKTESERMFS